MAFTSCNDWLDVNDDPNTPSAEYAKIEQLLPWCQHYVNYAYGTWGFRSQFACQAFTATSRVTRDGCSAQWEPTTSLNTTPYQVFFVGAGPNLDDMYEKAMSQGAYHYAACARLLRAYGFALMVDIYGEMPYTEAMGASLTPRYDDGKTIYLGIIGEVEEAIQLFGQEQAAGAPELAVGDSWNNGDVAKWTKMAYLLKARLLNHMSKKAQGDYKQGMYDPDEILACLDKAMQSNADNTVIRHTDTNGNTHDVLGWNETVDYSTVFSCVGMNSNYYITKTYYDNLTNFGNKGIEDPRADKFIPWVRSTKSANTPAEIKWTSDGKWRRSMGVDLQTNIISNSGPFATSWDAEKDIWFCNTDNAERKGDTIYVQARSSSKGYNSNVDLLYRAESGNDASAMSSIFQVRPSSPTYMGAYWEACFIKAEVLMRKDDKNGAFEAMKAGVKAHIEAVNDQLRTWIAEDGSLANCPSFTPMEQADIDKFLNEALGTAADVTMGKIMTQKLLTEQFMIETWNDIRRHDFDTNVFMNWDRSYEFKYNPNYRTYCPLDKGPRRWDMPTIEQNYNSINLTAIGEEIPGAKELPGGDTWYKSEQIKTLNVWWDSTQP